MKAIFMLGGYSALIDDEDYERVLKQSPWYVHVDKKNNLLCAYDAKGRAMDRFILNAKPWQEVKHVHDNGLDNQKRNLKLKSRKRKKKNASSEISS